ncbi:MAG: efflux RND transporter periplasmic adaptor subunit [Gemmataceae bacterium]|nr:efflux RND transporter periplasmic adaptor subunit [Gemmataceae bacterium]
MRAKRVTAVSPVLAVALAAATVSLPACHRVDAGEHGEAHHEHHKIVATSPRVQDVVVTQQYVCRIEAWQHVEISVLEPGRLDEIPVKEGQAVKKGDLLFRVMPPVYEAKLKAEQAELTLAELELKNTQSLREKGVVSPQEVQLYEAKVVKARAKRDLAQTELNFASVYAPWDGIVDRIERFQGSTVKEGEVLTFLSDPTLMWVSFNVPEARYLDFMARRGETGQVSRLKLVDSQIELVLADGSKFKHTAGDTVTVTGKFNSETGNIPFRADFPNPDRLLRHGQTGTVLIHETVHNALVIPQRATFEILDKRYVVVVDDHHVAHWREVVVGHELDDVYVVKSGVTPKDKIVLEGVRQVKDGAHVECECRSADEALAHQKHPAE